MSIKYNAQVVINDDNGTNLGYKCFYVMPNVGDEIVLDKTIYIIKTRTFNLDIDDLYVVLWVLPKE